LKVEELLFETSENISLKLYNMPNSLLYIDNTVVQEYTRRNETLAKYLGDKKEKDLEIAETASEEYKTENHEEPHQKPSEELQEESCEEPHQRPHIEIQEETKEETQEETQEETEKEPEKEPEQEPEQEHEEDLKENLEDEPEEDPEKRAESHMVIQKMQTDYPKINEFDEDSLYDEFDAPEKARAASEVHAKFRKDLSKNFDSLEISRPRGQTTMHTHTYSKDDLMNMANYYLPIEKRIFKSQNSSLDLAVSSTMITALRNFMNDGRSKQTTLTKAGSFTYEDLSHLQEEIESTAQNKKLN
jgi:hypothetical protein